MRRSVRRVGLLLLSVVITTVPGIVSWAAHDQELLLDHDMVLEGHGVRVFWEGMRLRSDQRIVVVDAATNAERFAVRLTTFDGREHLRPAFRSVAVDEDAQQQVVLLEVGRLWPTPYFDLHTGEQRFVKATWWGRRVLTDVPSDEPTAIQLCLSGAIPCSAVKRFRPITFVRQETGVSRIEKPEYHRILDDVEWNTVWQRGGGERAAPRVDFSQHMVIAVFPGCWCSGKSEAWAADRGEHIAFYFYSPAVGGVSWRPGKPPEPPSCPFGFFILPASSKRLVISQIGPGTKASPLSHALHVVATFPSLKIRK